MPAPDQPPPPGSRPPRHAVGADETFALVAHEIRAPLTVIAGYIELLGRQRLDEPTRTRALDESLRAVRRIEKLLDELTRASGPADLLAPAELDAVSMPSLAAEVAESFGHVANHVIDVRPSEAPMVLGDTTRLRQVLTNVVGNAVVHVPEGCRITISVTGRGDRVVTTVSDDGPGIPAEARERVFERFERAGTEAEGVPGAGLGLYIARTVVEAHGGTIRAEEGPGGRGTRIVIELPARTGPAEGPNGPLRS